MRYTASFACSIAVGLFALAVATPAQAQLSVAERKCVEGIAKESTKFVQKKGKTIQKCNDANIKAPGSCTDLATDIATLETKLRDGLAKKCPLNQFNFLNMGFPGKCPDPNPGDGFVIADLQDCIVASHEAAVDEMIDYEYGTTTGPIADTALQKCQSEIAKNAQKYAVATMKLLQKCRINIIKGKIIGVLPENCATGDGKTAEGIAKADSKARAKIAGKCVDAQIVALDVCNPDASTVSDASDCLITHHDDLIDTLDPAETDLLDIEFATGQPLCGDNARNTLAEECDGDDDSDCPNLCGAPDGFFACLCTDIPRQRVVEHANADLDNGWTGISHDSGIVEGGGYTADLYDCDNVTDFDCTVGPSCEVAPHPPCLTDAQCAFFGLGDCRKTRVATGPYCNTNINQSCTSDANCPGVGNFCVKQFHGSPLPLSSGGVSVCVVNVFSEDVTGTTNLQTGASSVSLRQRSITHLGPAGDQPCPICGGFCSGAAGAGGPGARTPCVTNADCPNSPNICITDAVCSWGPNVDQPCRKDPPFGGPTALFGTTSQDCPPFSQADLSSGGLDIWFNPATTGTVTMLPSFECDSFAFASNKCVGGSEEGRTCPPSTCPGGTCREQCFCQPGGENSTAEKPNPCNGACIGGSNPNAPCTSDAQCMGGGFCQIASCQLNALDDDSSQEGVCVNGPAAGTCSVHPYKGCTTNANCDPSECSFCDPGETCVLAPSQCFVNAGISRTGAPGATDKTTVALFCIAATGSAAINSTAGLPGPGAITNPVTTMTVGF